ncbi:MAG: hypothetical protein LBT30_05535 [Clostridiales bacterium]|jgi:hypothetical protein|nr:hypothetical protein [Clostridiales bacterium]
MYKKYDIETGTWSASALVMIVVGGFLFSMVLIVLHWLVWLISFALLIILLRKQIVYVSKAYTTANNGRLTDGKVTKLNERRNPNNPNGPRKYKISFEYYIDGGKKSKAGTTEWLPFTAVGCAYFVGKKIKVVYTATDSVIIKKIYDKAGLCIYPDTAATTAAPLISTALNNPKPAPKPDGKAVLIGAEGVGIKKTATGKIAEDWDYLAALPGLMDEHETHRKIVGDLPEMEFGNSGVGGVALPPPDFGTPVSDASSVRDYVKPDYLKPLSYVSPAGAGTSADLRYGKPVYSKPSGYGSFVEQKPAPSLQAQSVAAPKAAPTVKTASVKISAIKDKYATVELLSVELGMSKYDVREKIELSPTPIFAVKDAAALSQKLSYIGTKSEIVN